LHVAWSCPCRLRLNTTGSPIDYYRTKKVYIRRLSWPHDGSLNRDDTLEVSRADARRLLRLPPRAAFHHHGVLTPLRAGATAGRETAAPRAASRHDRSGPRPSRACEVATAWLRRSHWWARAVAGAGVRLHGANRNCSSNGRWPPAAATRRRPCTA